MRKNVIAIAEAIEKREPFCGIHGYRAPWLHRPHREARRARNQRAAVTSPACSLPVPHCSLSISILMKQSGRWKSSQTYLIILSLNRSGTRSLGCDGRKDKEGKGCPLAA
jgi:hypothetical protein